jgi:hypothetical protein
MSLFKDPGRTCMSNGRPSFADVPIDPARIALISFSENLLSFKRFDVFKQAGR